MPIQVSIVEDNDQLRGTLARLINRAEGFACLSQYPTAEAALEGLPKDRPQVVLMDINLPGLNGVECVRRLKQIAPEISAVMLTAYEDTENIFNALAAGANGYLLKRAPRVELLDAIREVHRGGSPMTTHIARKVVQSFQRAAPAPKPGFSLQGDFRENGN
jgi:DNA-binding NarL/FixJ family response regulator